MKETIKIQNLKCGGCKTSIIKNLNQLDGVLAVEVLEPEDLIIVDLINESTIKLVKDTLKQIGYPPINVENTLKNKTKSYVSCMLGKVSNTLNSK